MERERRSGGVGVGGGCFSCCFGGGEGGDGEEEEEEEKLGQRAARALRTSSRWVRDRAVELPEMVARAGRRRRKTPPQQQVAGEFRYDPVSYALNFEEDGDSDGEVDPFKYVAFSARLPASPPPPPVVTATVMDVDRGS
uniref:Uncharacterized protein n=1 Tax=Leersia perrieri TaxID=77586 RepID=A0A0D9X6D4_9ORYZ